MTSKTLLLGVFGIVVLVGLGYVVFSQKAANQGVVDMAGYQQDVEVASENDTFSSLREELEELTVSDEQDDDDMKESGVEEEEEVVETETADHNDTIRVSTVAESSVTTTNTAPKPVSVPAVSQYTTVNVALHSDASSCWTIVRGGVYDVTSFIGKHPGGSKRILSMCGRDATKDFEGQHDGERKPESLLAGLYLGALVQ